MAATENLSYCADQVRRQDRDRFLTALFVPADRREAVFALYAFNLEIAKTAEVVSEAMLGEIRLQWWRECIEGVYAGTPREHQVIRPLAQAVERHGLERALFEAMIVGRAFDLEGRAPDTLDALEVYAEATSATLLRLLLQVLGAGEDAAAGRAARHLGIAYALSGLLYAVPFHAGQKRLYLPADHLAAAGVDRRDLFELRGSERLSGVVMRLASRACEHLSEAGRVSQEAPRVARPAWLAAVVAEARLKRLAKADFDPFAPVLARPSALQSWRVALTALRGRL